jgi:predicted small lipoprotein YifL
MCMTPSRQRLMTPVVMAFVLALCACGQRSSLTLPSDEEAKSRASLPQILLPRPVTKPSAGEPQKLQNPTVTDNKPSNNSSNSPSNNSTNNTSNRDASPQ